MVTASRLDRHTAARILSIEALLWNPGQGAGAKVGAALGCGFHGKAVSNRKQTAVGSLAGLRSGVGIQPWRAASGPSFRVFGPESISGPDQSGRFPETKFFAGSRRMAGCACALKGGVILFTLGGKEWD